MLSDNLRRSCYLKERLCYFPLTTTRDKLHHGSFSLLKMKIKERTFFNCVMHMLSFPTASFGTLAVQVVPQRRWRFCFLILTSNKRSMHVLDNAIHEVALSVTLHEDRPLPSLFPSRPPFAGCWFHSLRISCDNPLQWFMNATSDYVLQLRNWFFLPKQFIQCLTKKDEKKKNFRKKKRRENKNHGFQYLITKWSFPGYYRTPALRW